MKVKVGVSNRHVHLTREAVDILFGKDYELTIKNKLTQRNQFAANETVIIKTTKNQIEKVRVLGPLRDYNQVEISKTDSYKLGINPPVRNSGDLEGSAPITIIGPKGILELDKGCIIAARHLHISTSDLAKYNLKENQSLSIKTCGEKGATLNNVHVKCAPEYVFEVHLDTDDANACLIKQGDEVELIINDKV